MTLSITYGPVQYKCINCGQDIVTRSTVTGNFDVTECNNCHPAYGGNTVKRVSSSQIEKFNRRYGR